MPEMPRAGETPGRIGANSAEGFHSCISQLHCEGLEDPSLQCFGFIPLSTHRRDLCVHHRQVQQAQRMEDVIKTSSAKGKGCHGHQVGVMVCVPRRNTCCFRLDLPYPGVRQNIFISKTDESTTEFPENMVMRENLSKQQSSKETGAKTATAF